MRKPLSIGVATLAVALSLGLAACGSSDDSSDDALSNADLIAQANEICTDYDNKTVEVLESTGLDDKSSDQEVAAFISDEVVPLYESQIEELRALQPNEDDADAYNDILDTFESELAAVKEDPEGSIAEENPFGEATAKADEFGLTVCGSNS